MLDASRDALYRLLRPIVFGLSVGAPLVLRVWAPPQYRPDELVLLTSLVIVSAVPYTAGLGASRTLLSSGRSRAVAVMTVVAAAGNLGLNLLLVPIIGLEGSALATLLAYGLLQGLLALSVPAALRPPRTAPRLLIGVLLTSAAGMLLTIALPTTPVGLGLRGLIAAGTLAWFGAVALTVSGRWGRA